MIAALRLIIHNQMVKMIHRPYTQAPHQGYKGFFVLKTEYQYGRNVHQQLVRRLVNVKEKRYVPGPLMWHTMTVQRKYLVNFSHNDSFNESEILFL